MIKFDTNPIDFPRTMRADNQSILTTGPAGVAIPFGFIPLFREDAATGRVTVAAELSEMPAPLENAVIGRLQTWFVPRPSLPQFEGLDEYTHAYQGKNITRLGASGRTPPSLFDTISVSAVYATANASEFFKHSGLTLKASSTISTDYVDAYILVQNYRLAQMSSKMTRYDYYQEDNTAALELKPALWPRNMLSNVVADYEQALVTGSLDLALTAGAVPVKGIGTFNQTFAASSVSAYEKDGSGAVTYADAMPIGEGNAGTAIYMEEDPNNAGFPNIHTDFAGENITTSLASIDTARKQQSFAKAVAAMDGNQFSGFNNDDVLILDLMNGFTVPNELLNRPWLLDAKQGVFGMTERHATDSANLDDSVVVGGLTLQTSINVPTASYGGIIFSTFEFMPERMYPRGHDEYLEVTSEADLPNALRDSLNTEPVEIVTNGEVDTAHTTPDGTFGYRELNAKWNRERTLMGGDFQSLTPGAHATAARTQIWQPEYVDPALNSDLYRCPHPFPQDVFSAPSNDSVTLSIRVECAIRGLTQFGSRLVEDNSEFADITTEKT
jgi:hypothetical protein